jgi:hypothetical protein
MRHTKRLGICGWGAMLVMAGGWVASPPSGAAVQTADTPAADIITGAWQHHHASFNYIGFTSLYTCDGLEGQVRQILLHLGARHDTKVTARGCPGPYNTPSHIASVVADFYTLAPATDVAEAGTVQARWAPVEVTPQRPFFMSDGDCELIQEMKDLITQNFSLRDVEYRTSCVPHRQTLVGFTVKGESLRALPPTASAPTG